MTLCIQTGHYWMIVIMLLNLWWDMCIRTKHLAMGNKLIHQIFHARDQCLSKDKNVEIGQVYYHWTICKPKLWNEILGFWHRVNLIEVIKQWSHADHMRSSRMGTKKVNKLWKCHGNRCDIVPFPLAIFSPGKIFLPGKMTL